MPTIQITTPTDLLQAKHIGLQIKEHGQEATKNQVKMYLSKCAELLDIQMSPANLDTYAIELLEMYPMESLEDIRECLKKGRRGEYSDNPKGRTYGKINLEVLSYWMSQHLEEKAMARERKIKQERNQPEEGSRLIDILEFQRQKINNMLAEGKSTEEIEPEYQKYKDLQEQLKEKSKKLREKLDTAANRKQQNTEEISALKAARIRNRKEIELQQARSFVKDYSDHQLKLMLSEEKDHDTREIIKQELINRHGTKNKGSEATGEKVADSASALER